jgi:hypothetical protein
MGKKIAQSPLDHVENRRFTLHVQPLIKPKHEMDAMNGHGRFYLFTDLEKTLKLSPSWSPKYQVYKLVKDARMRGS